MDIETTVVETEGKVWQKDLPELGDLEVQVAPWENPAFERAMQKGIRALPPALRPDGQVEPGAYGRVLGRAIARTIIFDWKNFVLGGVDKPFSAELAEELLVQPKYKVVRDGIIAAAKRAQLGQKADQDAIVGNSSQSSPGSENGAAK
jgi:hypothetical protein